MNLYHLNILLLVLTLWCIPWWMYNRFIRTKEFHPMGKLKFPTPYWASCGIPYVSRNPKKNDCTQVKFDGWSIGHVLIYITIGMVLPGYWFSVLGLSILCEAFEYTVGWRARWIIDPIANLIGYAIGHLVTVNLVTVTKTYPFLRSQMATFLFGTGLALLLFFNRPSMIPRGQEFY
jgi:hypothetical protein